MGQPTEFGYLLLFIVAGAAFVSITFLVNRLVRAHRPNEEKLTTYECGEDPIGNAWGRFNIRFYVIALIFVLFDVEIVFLFPWATVFGQQQLQQSTDGLWGWFALAEMGIFVGLLALALAYSWAKGYLDWVKPQAPTRGYNSHIPKSQYEEVNRRYE